MNTEIISKLTEFLKKPRYFIVIGIALLTWNKYYPGEYEICALLGWILISIPIIDYTIDKIKQRQQKNLIIKDYNELSEQERNIVDECCMKNKLVYCDVFADIENISKLRSLAARGFGVSQGSEFIMNKKYFNVLRQHIIKKRTIIIYERDENEN